MAKTEEISIKDGAKNQWIIAFYGSFHAKVMTAFDPNFNSFVQATHLTNLKDSRNQIQSVVKRIFKNTLTFCRVFGPFFWFEFG